MMRQKLAVVALTTVVALLTACQVRVVQPSTKPSPTPAPSAPAASTPKPSQPQPSAPPAQPQTPAPAASDKITKTAIYLGLADSHTIEVGIDGKPAALRLADEVKPSFEALKLKKDDKIEIKYHQNDSKQLVVTEIRTVR